MLAHFYEVSQAMPPEQGRRYLAEMQRLTLGFHEQIENTMSPRHVFPSWTPLTLPLLMAPTCSGWPAGTMPHSTT